MVERLVVPGPQALKSCVGRAFGPSEWLAVLPEQVRAFADATGDHQWIHVDSERARRESPFGGPVAHGYLTIALTPALLPQIFQVQGVSLVVNVGLERLKLSTPVPVGGRLRLSGELKSARALRNGAVRVSLALRFELEGAARPACTAEAVYLYYPET